MRASLLLGCLSLATIAAPALVTTAPQPAGTITGVVTASEGSGLPGVTVSVAKDSWSREVLSGEGGRFRITDVPAGSYTVWYTLPGFTTVVQQHVTVAASAAATLNAILRVAPITETVTVTSHGPRGPVLAPEVAVQLETTVGTIEIAVNPARAPITADNFLKYVDAGFYDDGRFHRATRADNYVVNLPNRPLLEVIQAGIDPAKRAKAFPPIPLERTSVTRLRHVVGTVSMARGAPDSATSDFFILLNDQPSLDFGGKRFDDGQGAAAFGRVISGMDVVRKIQQQPTKGQSLEPPITIIRADRVTR
jgi:peptidyl-prolyl cis-trans isomerase A (cyclophilin A)